MDQTHFGSRISRLRQNKNMTQEQLAARIGVTPQALSRWERGQSLPDLFLLTEACQILEVSADELLGISTPKSPEQNHDRRHEVVWSRLRNCLEPLELIFGEKLVPVFMNDTYMQKIVEQREKLAAEGILMPVVRVRDELELETNEFQIVSYRRKLYSERLTSFDEHTCDYICGCLGRAVQDNYAHILNQELVKELTDNLQIKFPVLVGGAVPGRISYGLLTDVLKALIRGGCPIAYLEKVIEILDRILRRSPETPEEELARIVSREMKEHISSRRISQ